MNQGLELVGWEDVPDDSAIYVDLKKPTKRLLTGIDITGAEIAYASRKGYDAVLAHHPFLPGSWKVFERHIEQMVSVGIPKEEAKNVVNKRTKMLRLAYQAQNSGAVPSFAKANGMQFLNVHSPCDELGRRLISEEITNLQNQNSNIKLSEVKKRLKKRFPEFRKAKTEIEVALGDSDAELGRWIFSHGALTNGGSALANKYFKHGLDTVIYIHIAPGELSAIQKEYPEGKNLMVLGHIASDCVGFNPLIEAIRDKGVEVTAVGGIIEP